MLLYYDSGWKCCVLVFVILQENGFEYKTKIRGSCAVYLRKWMDIASVGYS